MTDASISLVSDGVFGDFLLRHADEMWIDSGGVDIKVYDPLQVGYSYTHPEYGSFPGPYFTTLYHRDTTADASFTRDGDTIAWSIYQSTDTLSHDGEAYLDTCGAEISDSSEGAGGEDAGAESTLPCDMTKVDIWEITTSGGDMKLTVDTIAAETAFDPALVFNDSSGCVSLYADDGFACTFPPPTYQCPAATLSGTSGTQQLVVFNIGDCAGDEGAYRLSAEGEGADTLTLVEDDADRYIDLVVNTSVIDISACGQIYRTFKPDDTVVCDPSGEESDSTEDTDILDTGTP